MSAIYKYLVLPRMRAQSVNAQPCWWIIGPPALTAYAGFAHALTLAERLPPHCGVGIVHHDLHFLAEDGPWLSPHQFRAASLIDGSDYASTNKNALSAQPTARAHLTASMIIRLPIDAVENVDARRKFLRGGRLASGSIVDCGDTRSFTSLTEAVKAIGGGFAIIERQDLMAPTKEDTDILDTLLRVTRHRSAGEPQESWLCPSTMGFAALTAFAARDKARGELPHAFVEPLIGLMQFKSLRELSGQRRSVPFWRYTQPRPDVFVLTTQDPAQAA